MNIYFSNYLRLLLLLSFLSRDDRLLLSRSLSRSLDLLLDLRLSLERDLCLLLWGERERLLSFSSRSGPGPGPGGGGGGGYESESVLKLQKKVNSCNPLSNLLVMIASLNENLHIRLLIFYMLRKKQNDCGSKKWQPINKIIMTTPTCVKWLLSFPLLWRIRSTVSFVKNHKPITSLLILMIDWQIRHCLTSTVQTHPGPTQLIN